MAINVGKSFISKCICAVQPSIYPWGEYATFFVSRCHLDDQYLTFRVRSTRRATCRRFYRDFLIDYKSLFLCWIRRWKMEFERQVPSFLSRSEWSRGLSSFPFLLNYWCRSGCFSVGVPKIRLNLGAHPIARLILNSHSRPRQKYREKVTKNDRLILMNLSTGESMKD